MLSMFKEKSRELVDIIFSQPDTDNSEVLGTVESLNIHANDVKSFASQLNDQAINAYCAILARGMDQTRLHAKVIDTFILMDMIRKKKRISWGITKEDINTFDILYGCANESGRHWVAIILDTRNHTFLCMDPLNDEPTRKIQVYFQNFNTSAKEKGLRVMGIEK